MTNTDKATAIARTINARYEGLKFEAPAVAPRRTGKVRTARHNKRRTLR